MTPIVAVLKTFFEEEEWETTFTEDTPPPRFYVPFQGEHSAWTCVALALEDRGQMIFYSIAPSACPEDKRAVMMEFLHRANYGLHMGNFEFDGTDGEIRFKTSIDVEGAALNSTLCRNVIYMNCFMMERYLPGLLGLIYGDMTAVEAMRKVDGSHRTPDAPPTPDISNET